MKNIILVCNRCEWVGWATDAVHPKHDLDHLLCPECHETTEAVTPKWFSELRDELDRQVDIAEQALREIDLDNRVVLAFAGLTVLKCAVDCYRGQG